MTNKTNPLDLLLAINTQEGLNVDEHLINECYELLKIHQYDSDPNTVKEMGELVEKVIQKLDKDINS